jgi:histidine triad (HIT) family protein
MTADDCIFCKIAESAIAAEKVYEDGAVVAFLDIAPISEGHTLVIPKAHHTNVHSCPPEVLGQIASCISRIAVPVTVAVDAEAYNVLCNNGRPAGQLVEHLHFHIIPRTTGDGVFTRWPASEYPDGRAEQIAEKIRKNL